MYINNDALQPDKLEEILALRPEGADVEPKKVDDLYGRKPHRYRGCAERRVRTRVTFNRQEAYKRCRCRHHRTPR